MTIIEAAEAVLQTYIITDPDRTICLCCQRSELDNSKPLQHAPDCAVGDLAGAVQGERAAGRKPAEAAA